MQDGGDGEVRTESLAKRQKDQEFELQILERAREFGITNLGELQQQVFRMKYQNNLAFWCLLLERQQYRPGAVGVKKIWHFMKDTGGKLEDFFYGPIADQIWSVLISTGLKDQDFLRRLCVHEKRLGAQRPTMYLDVVGSLLRIGEPVMASALSQQLQASHPVTGEEVFQLFLQACEMDSEEALDHFRVIMNTLPEIRSYSRVVPHLCSQDRFLEAWKMHTYLLSRGDLPPDFESIRPLIESIAQTGLGFDDFLQGLKRANISFEGQARRLHEHLKSLGQGFVTDNMNVVTSKTLGFRPTKLSDEFVARAFATTAFSFDFVFNGLLLLGLSEIGPLALRQLALGAADHPEISKRLALLRDADVDHGSSIYARVVTKLVAQGKPTLLSDVLQSDQHPDVFEDLELQGRLLVQYYRNSEWRQVNTTVAILTIATQGAPDNEGLSELEVSFNVLFRCAVQVGDRKGIARLMAQVKECGWRLTNSNVWRMSYGLLLPRQPTLRPMVDNEFDDVGYIISLWQTAKEAGTHISPTAWREPIRRLGMLRRWVDLERLLFWLATNYSSERELTTIFSEPLQRAVVAWGFLSPLPPQAIPLAPSSLKHNAVALEARIASSRGVKILRLLRSRYKVSVRASTVRTSCLQRLRVLFGHLISRRLVNWTLRRKNRTSLREYLEELENAWSAPLFPRKMIEIQKMIHEPPRDTLCKARSDTRLKHLDLQMLKRRFSLERLKLQQARKAIKPLRTSTAEPLQTSTAEHHPVADVVENSKVDKLEDSEDNVVVYRDLFNASWKDYEKRD